MVHKMSLKNKFLLPTITLIILGMGISTGISSVWSGKALKESITDQIAGITKSTVNVIDAWINDRTLDVKSWSRQKVFQTALKDSFVGKAAKKTASNTLTQVRDEYKYYENICLANKAGEIVAAADPTVIDKVNVANQSYFQKTLEGQVVISEVVKSPGTGNPIFVVTAPIKEKEHVTGILFGVVDTNYFSEQFVDPILIGESGRAFMFMRDGMVIAHPDKQQILAMDMKAFEFGEEMMKKKDGWISFSHNGIKKVANYKQSEKVGWTLCVSAVTREINAPVKRLSYVNSAVTASVVLLAIVVILLLVRSTVNPIHDIANGLNKGSDKVALSSLQLSSASQVLADGSSQQAASIEEASSSLEEMASMTKQNAASAGTANDLMLEASNGVHQADNSMSDLITAMQDISKASDETSKIIKTIDEIAFQTNLLALNAAVEAARAGEAGAGFAVVADEVRNLAIRAADAARNTADLIKGTVHKVSEGSDLLESTNNAFQNVSEKTAKVGELVAEIAAASNEQAQGIEQINLAVVQMDKVVQANAAYSEESASASEDMRVQAEQMKDIVHRLVLLVGKNRKTEQSPDQDQAVIKPNEQMTTQIDAADTNRKKESQINKAGHHRSTADQLPPLDEEEFENF